MLGLALHVPFNLFFIYVVDWGYLGCAVATVCFQFVQPIFMITYLFGFSHGRQQLLESMGGRAIGRTGLSFWKEFSLAISSLQGYLQYLGLALPGIIIISEWWASETAIFLSGRLEPYPELALGGEIGTVGRILFNLFLCIYEGITLTWNPSFKA
jgi:MATE family multidrug resistance protein